MRNIIRIKIDGFYHISSVDFTKSPYNTIYCENVCFIQLQKHHDHDYSLQSFFYDKRVIICRDRIKTKTALVQLIEELIATYVYA